VSFTRASRPIGMTTDLEVEAQRLDRYVGAGLDGGFAVEDAKLDGSCDLAGVDAGSGRFTNVLLDGAGMAASRLRGVGLREVLARKVDASNADWTGATMAGVVFEECRLTGMQLPEAELREVAFRRCKLDYVNFRMASLSQVTFEGCVLDDTDFAHARLALTRFATCEVRNSDFRAVELSEVDFRGSELAFRGDVRALRGAILSPLQLIDLSRALARAVGIRVEEE
jgi:uncharacterized protein YjbI with pentapeptide repeats